MIRKFRKKPAEIEAIQVPAEGGALSNEEIVWLQQSTYVKSAGGGAILIETLEGTMTASPGDWIIRGVQGELYPCKPDIFEATYEQVT